MKIVLHALAACLGGIFASTASVADDAAGVRIAVSEAAGSVTLQAFADLPDGAFGRYEFIATKTGASGSSVTRQAGTVARGRTSALTTSKLSLHVSESLDAELLVTTSTGQVYRDKVELRGRPTR